MPSAYEYLSPSISIRNIEKIEVFAESVDIKHDKKKFSLHQKYLLIFKYFKFLFVARGKKERKQTILEHAAICLI